jgi:hypothetical protein
MVTALFMLFAKYGNCETIAFFIEKIREGDLKKMRTGQKDHAVRA